MNAKSVLSDSARILKFPKRRSGSSKKKFSKQLIDNQSDYDDVDSTLRRAEQFAQHVPYLQEPFDNDQAPN